ncbi:unnamed protein product [Medioppia subpectinata]|uniref:Uncharacterized protein n=1 Tax=Medioppia subpectinata TaxID=1979941 RepID=A0A7R9Q685_9ACAR|nr:unnamed protein product [Medioppia subpectinata]CAG2114148.1 unnamed protein product [Medioppia subpectinata]
MSLRDFNIISTIVSILKSIGVYYVLVVLLGAPILSQKLNTLYLSVLLTSLTTIPILVYCKHNNIQNLMNNLNYLRIEAKAENVIVKTSVLTVMGSWFGAFPLALDWMQPWQEWPVSSHMSSFYSL